MGIFLTCVVKDMNLLFKITSLVSWGFPIELITNEQCWLFSLRFLFLMPVQGVVFSDYDDSSAVSGEMPNWQAYLILPSYLAWLGNQSTHWRATCRYDTDGVVYRDYMRTSLADFDIMNIQEPITGVCSEFEFINIRGYECVSCTAPLWNRKGIASLHTDSSKNVCEFNGNQGDVVDNEDNFGGYSTINPAFRCSSNPDSTTQFWIGGQ